MAAELIPPRLDALDKVTGRARFIEDLPELPGSAFAAAIRSPYSHARILSIDSSAAQSLPGVLGVLHRDQFGDFPVHPQPRSECQDFVARDLVRFDGDLVGLVAAIDPRIAVEAARLVDVEYELLPPVFSFTEAVATDAPVLHEGAPDNIAVRDTLEWGDVEAGFGKAAHVVEGTFYAPSAFHHPMEPASSFQLHWHGGELEVWAPAHKLFRVREELAELLEIAPEQVRVHTPYIGGSFGGKDETSLALNAAAVLSRSIGRPIRYSAGAEESFRANARHAMTYRGRLGISETGEIVALDVELELDTGAYLTGAEVVTNNAVGSAMGPYRVPNLRVVAQTAYTNKVPAATFRSTGRSQTTFALESLIDDAAAQSGLDPVEFRLKNLLRRGERLGAPVWRRRRQEMPSDAPPIDADVDAILTSAVDGLGSHPSEVGDEGSRRVGRGVAVSIRRSSNSGSAQAEIRFEPDGSVVVAHNAPDLGEGSHTVLQIIAARSLGVPHDAVHIGEPDSANGLEFSGVSSQRTTMQMGTAVAQAARDLKGQLEAAAARLHESPAPAWRLIDGELHGPDEARIGLPELAGNLPPGQRLVAKGAFHTRHEAGEARYEGRDHWTAGAAAVDVEVDRETGTVRVLRCSAVGDAGKAIHYPSAKGQVEGGAMLGLGLALHEEMLYQDGQLLNGDPFQYRLPLMRDLPPGWQTTLREMGDGPGPFGSKALAQTSVPCITPAVANAIRAAVGVRLHEAPFTPQRILDALESDSAR